MNFGSQAKNRFWVITKYTVIVALSHFCCASELNNGVLDDMIRKVS